MEKLCIVMVGEWRSDDTGLWEFVIEKGRYSRLVNIEERFTFEDLRVKVALVFGEGNSVETSFSYWPPMFSTSSNGRKTPPVVIRSEECFMNFLSVLFANKEMNLYVTFLGNGDSTIGTQRVDGVVGLRTPGTGSSEFQTPRNDPVKLKGIAGTNVIVPGSGRHFAVVDNNKRKRVDFEGECSNGRPSGSRKCVSASLEPICLDDYAFLEEVEAIEEKLKSGSKSLVEPSFDLMEEDETDNELVEVANVDELEVTSRGYDKDLWVPLLDDQLGGSNALEIMCTDNDRSEQLDGTGGRTRMDGYARNERINFISADDNSARNFRERVDEQVPRRVLGEVNDEEFDIPPLFDDLTFEISDIPDLEIDDEDGDIYVGKTFGSKVDCQIALAIYAIRNMFNFKQSRTKKHYFVVRCVDMLCEWRVNAHMVKDSTYYQIRKAILTHSCSIETRSKFTRKATSRVIAAVYKARFNSVGGAPKPLDVQQLVLEDLRVSTSYFKCWKAIGTAHEELRGTEEESFTKLAEYLYMLKLANPGTRTEIETEDNGFGGQRFLYMFLAFGASIVGFRNLRTVLVIDGTHLTGKYKGVLLTASGQDANFQVFPLAFAVVDSENDKARKWFLTRVALIIADSPNLSIVSDRNQSIYTAIQAVFPKAKHGACIVHLARNVVANFKSKGLAKQVVKATCAYRVGVFKEVFGQIQNSSPQCAKYLFDIGFPHWTRAAFGGDRYNLMTSNIAETLNNCLRNARDSPIIELVMFIQSMLTRWFSARRAKALSHRGLLTPEVDKVISSNLATARGSRVGSIDVWSFEVTGLFGQKNNVNLQRKSCSCKFYDRLKIPCGHALLAGDFKGVPYCQLTADYYRTAAWAKTYARVIQPHEDPRDGVIPHEIRAIVILPPKTRRPSGRPPQKRIPSTGEILDGKSQRGSSNRCGRCKGIGHNKVSCRNPI